MTETDARALSMKRRAARYWTPEEDRLVRERYPHERTEVLAAELNRGITAVGRRAWKLGICKTDEFRASIDRSIAPRCRTCGTTNPGDFYRRPDGRMPRKSKCHDCQRAENRERRRQDHEGPPPAEISATLLEHARAVPIEARPLVLSLTHGLRMCS